MAEPTAWSVAVPDVSGCGFTGGRLVATARGPAALHVCDHDHRRPVSLAAMWEKRFQLQPIALAVNRVASEPSRSP